MVRDLIKKGELNPYVVVPINMLRLSREFGWTPTQILNENVFWLNCYERMLDEIDEAHGSSITKQEKRELGI